MDSGIVQKKLEQAFLESPTDSFAIFQLKHGEEQMALRFLDMASLKKSGLTAEKANYDLIYTGTLPQAKPVPSTLEDLYVTFNQNCPEDFCGHSLSVSDIVAIKHYGMVSCHYLDSVGYAKTSTFLCGHLCGAACYCCKKSCSSAKFCDYYRYNKNS